tara:strand:+ start:723 stop:1085 length:363 start_codon:yes stop_codon:yes gene_type:complete
MESEKQEIIYHRHSCPNCGNYVGNKRIYLKAWLWAQWECRHCGAKLCFSKKRRVLIACLSGIVFLMAYLPMVAMVLFKPESRANFPYVLYIQPFSLVSLMVLFGLSVLFVFSFDKIEIKK